MTYATIATIQMDGPLSRRMAACAATQGIASPVQWVTDHSWQLAAQPGWAAAWESAIAGGVQTPGAQESVITDSMLLSAVQALNV